MAATGTGGQGDDEEAADDAAMQRRLAALTGALDASRQAAPAPGSGGSASAGIGEAMNLGFRVMTEFVASVAVGGVIGWALDHWLQTSPFCLILFIALGTAAGFWSVYKIAARPTGAPKPRP